MEYAQILRTARHPPALLQTVRGVPVLRLAEHEIICFIDKWECQNCASSKEANYSPLYSLQYAPMKNAALFSGALVVPISCTLGTFSGSGVGSLYGRSDHCGSCVVVVAIVCSSLEDKPAVVRRQRSTERTLKCGRA